MKPAEWQNEHLFVFGSLMDLDVLQIVTACAPANLQLTQATAVGFKQCEVAEESYPVLVPEDNASCHGQLISGLDATAMDRIHFYEGDEYVLSPIRVELEADYREAWYFRDAGVYTVLEAEWSFTDWQRIHKTRFLETARTYMQLYGTMSASEANLQWQRLSSRE